MNFMKRHGKRIVLEGAGWLLVVIGIAALVLPGPGLLALFAGMALLATQYEWAERRLVPLQKAALKTAADSVSSLPRIIATGVSAGGLIAAGIVWGMHPDVPAWWPLSDKWWLVGGWGTGATLIGSGILAFGMLVYSYKKFRPGLTKHKH